MRRSSFFIAIVVVLVSSFVAFWWREEKEASLLYQKNVEDAYAAGATVLAETAVATLDGIRVPIAGYQSEQPSMDFYLPDGVVQLGIGDDFQVGSKKYEILNIWEDEDGHGYVSFIEV